MNFAPYQDDNPERTRALSPSPDGRAFSPRRAQATSPKPYQSRIDDQGEEDPGDIENNIGNLPSQNNSAFGNGVGADERNVDLFGTSLPMRLDYEAMMAYVLLPPAGGAFLLMVEHKSDYVRFHAWQSSLLFAFLFILHIIISFSSFLSFFLLVVDLVMIAFLAQHAYKDADTLDRYEVPFFGRLASSFVDDE